MSKLDKELKLKALLAAGASSLALTFAGPAFAQDETPVEDAADEVVEIIEEEVAADTDTDDTIVVTGSRIKKSTFNSLSPLQVITTDAAKDVGLIDPSAILQQSEAAAGQQIDSSFQGFVLDNGPGSQTINLRGLGASRTLLLINGRRMAPAGVEGAPTNPSLNLIPGSLVERYELLLDGASSVYGSDAVAGVGNMILRQDFEGFEVGLYGEYNEEGAGNDYTVNAAWGKNNDRGFIGVGVEYDYTDAVTFGDRDFLAGCNTHYEIDENGRIRTLDARSAYDTEQDSGGTVTAPHSPCKIAGSFTDRIFEQSPAVGFGSAYFVGAGNGNILDAYSDTGLFGVPVDADGDGIIDIYFPDFTSGARDLAANLLSEQKKSSIMAYGEYVLEGESNLTPYFEAMHVNNDISANSGVGAIFPDIPADNPFNVCNPAAAGGVDCGLAQDALLNSPGYRTSFDAFYNGGGGSANCFGVFGPTPPVGVCTPDVFGIGFGGPIGPIVVNSNGGIRGDRNLTDVTLAQTRGVIGIKGDMPWLTAGSLQGWSFDTSLSYSYAEGSSSRPGIRDDRLALALGWDPTTDLNSDGEVDGDTIDAENELLLLPGGPCDVAGVSNPGLLQPDAAAGCVPVNFFAPSIYQRNGAGDFATQAERDYLFDTRDFDTTYEQTIFNGYVTGQLFELPAGAVAGVAGVEYRIDSIDSQPDLIASEGLFFGFFKDAGAEGEKWTREAFFELDVPLLADSAFGRELSTNLSARYTEDEFYGDAWTYAAKLGYRPVDSLLLKASLGTSFRAPNLRENFLKGQSGFNSVFDPCAVPGAAVNFDPLGGVFVYDASNDPRVTQNPEVITNCLREGRDPTTIGFDPVSGSTIQFPGVEITTGGTDEIGPETSESFTAGFSFEQPWFEAFDLTVAATYIDIEIEDTIIEPSAQFLVSSCFSALDTTNRSVTCDSLSYGSTGLVTDIDQAFLNQDKDTYTGIDYNARFSKEFTAFDQPMDLGINIRANQLKERGSVFVNDDLSVSQDDDVGEFGFPEWSATSSVFVDVNDYRFTWGTRYVGDVGPDVDVVNDFGDALNSTGTGFRDTCLGPLQGDVQCKDVDFADSYLIHTAAIRYTGDTMVIRAGVRNLLDTEPPQVDSSQVFAVSNVPIGNGYDLNGREFYFSIDKDF